MGIADSGLNKPYDRILKAFVDEAPGVFLQLLGIVPPGAAFRLLPLRPEIAPPVVLPDFVASLEIGSAEPVILHIEFLLAYHSGITSSMARYGGSLAWQYGREVVSLLVLLRRRGVPRRIPDAGEVTIGKTFMRHPFRSVRLWELDPGPILETKDPRLLPWSVLMRSSDDVVRRVAEILGRDGDQESIGRFLTMGSLRYDRSLLERMLGGPKMGLMEAIIEGSSIFQEIREKATREGREAGRQEGQSQGEAQGRTSEARRSLRIVLKAKFPGLETAPEIDAIASPEILESLLELAVISSQKAEIEAAISASARRN